ncbi:hypothetical protein [Pseudoalteromonas piscicida]|uniref:Uncharacterized protein n=1 Tax=Pseudoalteromonas piscicida TaxID=43662 RepID=A0A2A5JNQ8_PSEO7|nr:hypothetical protein [Pseudoalteromonas piscicida]PCK31082.1 hypothetical protein CEX98_13555 [Pseudoalteromonas piscicida]
MKGLKVLSLAMMLASTYANAKSDVSVRDEVRNDFLNDQILVQSLEQFNAYPNDEQSALQARAILSEKLHSLSTRYNLTIEQVDAIIMNQTIKLDVDSFDSNVVILGKPDVERITVHCDDDCKNAAYSGHFTGWAETAASNNNVGYGEHFNIGYDDGSVRQFLRTTRTQRIVLKMDKVIFEKIVKRPGEHDSF